MTRIIKAVSLALLLGALFGAAAKAQTINAASCNASDVQTAFSAVTTSTTTVNIPAGTCTWTTQVTLTVPSGSTSLTIQGQTSCTGSGAPSSNNLTCTDNTTIVDNYNSSNSDLVITTNSTASSFFRLTGITFQGGSSGDTKYAGFVQFLGSSQNIRLDHMHFNEATYGSSGGNSSGAQYNGCTYGVVDHSIFNAAANSVTNHVRAYNSGTCFSDSLGVGDESWAHSTSLGSNSFLFVENNVFNNGASDDCTDGGRFVFRFNTFNVTTPAPSVQTHPTGGAGRIRGCRAWEVYENEFSAASGNYMNAALWLSSGTGVVWGNIIPSSSAGGGTGYQNFIELLSMRQTNATYAQTAPPNGWGYCGTAFSGAGGVGCMSGGTVCSNWDHNSAVSSGYRCMDQPGQGVGDFLTGGFSADGSGTNNVTNSVTGCVYSSPCAWPAEASEPIYEWMDEYSPVPNNPSNLLANNGAGAFVANSDYYIYTLAWNGSAFTGTAFSGIVGTGSGVLASLPLTCTTGVGYWATDQGNWNQSGSGGQGELFVCTAANTWTLYYTPYTYPHPLDITGIAPNAPTSLQATPH